MIQIYVCSTNSNKCRKIYISLYIFIIIRDLFLNYGKREINPRLETNIVCKNLYNTIDIERNQSSCSVDLE